MVGIPNEKKNFKLVKFNLFNLNINIVMKHLIVNKNIVLYLRELNELDKEKGKCYYFFSYLCYYYF